MAYDPSDEQKTDPLKYVSDTVLGRADAKPVPPKGALIKPKTYEQYDRAPGQTEGFPLQEIASRAQARLGPLVGQLREAASPLAHQEPVNLSRMYHQMMQATGAEPPPQPTRPNPALPPGYTGYGLENLDRDEARQEAARERSYGTEYGDNPQRPGYADRAQTRVAQAQTEHDQREAKALAEQQSHLSQGQKFVEERRIADAEAARLAKLEAQKKQAETTLQKLQSENDQKLKDFEAKRQAARQQMIEKVMPGVANAEGGGDTKSGTGKVHTAGGLSLIHI